MRSPILKAVRKRWAPPLAGGTGLAADAKHIILVDMAAR